MSRSTKNKPIYLDNAAATPIDLEVKKEMARTMEFYGNPSSFNGLGRVAKKKLEESRSEVSRFIGSRPEEVIFTSSGSEANNLAILGLAKSYPKKKEIIVSPIEHPSVLEPLRILRKKGYKIKFLRVDSTGLVDIADLRRKITGETLLVSVMYANNEIGSIQLIAKISKVIRNFRDTSFPFFHTDACQATSYLDMNVNNLGVDLMIFNGAKIYGPRGIGALYKNRRVILEPLIRGGDQEHGLRAGTENLPAIVGLAKAVSLVDKKEGNVVAKLRDYFFEKIKIVIPDVRINGPTGDERLPNNINISILGLSDENLLLELDKYGIYASSGSACTARSVEPSHVLKAIGVDDKYLHGALRFSLGRQTTKMDVDYVLKILPKTIRDLKKRYSM